MIYFGFVEIKNFSSFFLRISLIDIYAQNGQDLEMSAIILLNFKILVGDVKGKGSILKKKRQRGWWIIEIFEKKNLIPNHLVRSPRIHHNHSSSIPSFDINIVEYIKRKKQNEREWLILYLTWCHHTT